MKSDITPEIGTTELIVPTLGKIKGFSYDDKVCQYLGIPYGKIPGRFRRSVPADAWAKGTWDGTKLGYVFWLFLGTRLSTFHLQHSFI